MEANLKETGRGRGAFTLTELLVAIGIIAVLAGIAFPVMAAVNRRAKTAACLSNLRECGVVIHLYANDHDYSFPPASINGGQGYVVALAPYLPVSVATAHKNIYVSPAAVYPTARTDKNFTYAVHNGLFGGTNADGSSQQPLKVLDVTRPAEVIMMANGSQQAPFSYNCAFTFYYPTELNQGKGAAAASIMNNPIPASNATNVDGPAGQGYLRYVQNGNTAVNALMVDGHVVTIPKGKVLYKNVVYDR